MIRLEVAVLPEADAWTATLMEEFDRYSGTLVHRDGMRYRCPITNVMISEAEMGKIREEVLNNAIANHDSLAFHILTLANSAAAEERHLPCDIAVRLGWGISATRRALGLPASDDLDPMT